MYFCIRFCAVLLSFVHQEYFVAFFRFHLFIFCYGFMYYWCQSDAGYIECIQKNCFLWGDGDKLRTGVFSLNVQLNLVVEPSGSGLFVTGFFQLIKSHFFLFACSGFQIFPDSVLTKFIYLVICKFLLE